VTGRRRSSRATRANPHDRRGVPGQLPQRPYHKAGEHNVTVTGTCPHHPPGDLTRPRARREAPDKSRALNGLFYASPHSEPACTGMSLRSETTTGTYPRRSS
jgi:hypothetical protein